MSLEHTREFQNRCSIVASTLFALGAKEFCTDTIIKEVFLNETKRVRRPAGICSVVRREWTVASRARMDIGVGTRNIQK